MVVRLRDMTSLRQLLTVRGLSMDAVGMLAGVDTATISRICSGQVRPTPQTIFKLATALGINARRMRTLCDAAWKARESGEEMSP